LTLDTEAVEKELSLGADAPQLRRRIAKEVGRRVRRSRLSEVVTSEDQADAVAVGLEAIFQPVAPVDQNGCPQPGDWWHRYGAEVAHRDALVVKFGADRAMQWLAREVAGRRRRMNAQAQWLRHLLPLVAGEGPNEDPTGDASVRSVLRAKTRTRVRAAVEALDKPERMVIEARYWAGDTWTNIAATQGIGIRKAHRLHDAALRELAYWLRPLQNTTSKG
jgi:hypothetical protein